MTLANLDISSADASVILSVVLTFAGLAVAAFVTFFLRRLVTQLDEMTKSLQRLNIDFAVLKADVQSLQRKTTSVTVKDDDPP